MCRLLDIVVSALCSRPPKPTPGNPTPAAALGRDLRLIAIHLMEHAVHLEPSANAHGQLPRQLREAAEAQERMVKLLLKIVTEVRQTTLTTCVVKQMVFRHAAVKRTSTVRST